MKNFNTTLLWLGIVVSNSTNLLLAQNTLVRSSTFDMAFAIANGPTIQAKSAVGEPLSGFTKGTTFAIGSGFVADSVVQSHLTGVEEVATTLPSVYALKQNYPNPFNPSTTIAYELPKRSNVAIVIYNMLGQKVAALVDEDKSAGRFSVVWNGRSSTGIQTASGVYFCRFQAKSLEDGSSFVDTKKLILLK